MKAFSCSKLVRGNLKCALWTFKPQLNLKCEELYRFLIVITARVRSTTRGYVFIGVCLLTGGGGAGGVYPTSGTSPFPTSGQIPSGWYPSPVTGPAQGSTPGQGPLARTGVHLQLGPGIPAGTEVPPTPSQD